MSQVRVADVALDPRSVGADAIYTYRAEADTRIGDAVFVPLGTRNALGFVVGLYDATEAKLGFPFARLKPIAGTVEGLALPHQLVNLAQFVSDEYLCSLPVALSPAVPPGVRDRLVTTWTLASNRLEGLTAAQSEIVRTLRDLGGSLEESRTKPLPSASVRILRLLRNKGLVKRSLRISLGAEKRGSLLLQLTTDAGRIEAFLRNEGKRRPAQTLTIIRLQSAERVRLTRSEIKALAGVTEATIKALVDAKILEPTEADAARVTMPPVPNRWQQLAIDAISEAVVERREQGFLLFGVTGSGKTEVFLRCAAEALRQGRQALYVVPEIALATQSISLLRDRFGVSVSVLHSELSPVERLRNWTRIRDGESGIVLGARSALFAPLDNIGLIIVDEEHEASYKQESAPRYHARAVARFLARAHRCPVVLGSATPSIESFYEAESSELGSSSLTLLSLPERAATAATLPIVDIEDLKIGYHLGAPAILTPELARRIQETLERREQVILFLNRRAYAPFLMCRDCGHRMECPNCAVSLSFHRKDRRLRCHHCGYSRYPPATCPSCGGSRLNPFGAGTEKVEEIVAETFPSATVARLDRDIARRKGALERILTEFRTGDIDILVGTQMVAKGLDFPNVTLVGVIAADVSLNLPDFRSSERTYQLLSQVAGRAGRGSAPGTVIIQTFNPDHPSVTAAQAHEYLPFYEALKAERRDAGYPPFTRLANITFSGLALTAVREASDLAKKRLLGRRGLEILGPVDCALERVQNRWRRHLMVKMDSHGSVAEIGDAMEGLHVDGVQWVIDIDPYTVM